MKKAKSETQPWHGHPAHVWKQRAGCPCHARASALLVVLWSIALLSLLLTTTALLVIEDVKTLNQRHAAFRARQLARTGLALASHPDIKPDDPLLHRQIAELERLDVEIRGGDGLLNPNVLLQGGNPVVLPRLFQAWGLKQAEAETLVDALIDWIDPDDFTRRQGAESKNYPVRGRPFNQLFRSLEEMALVRGMDRLEALHPDWRAAFSLRASGKLDVNSAEPELLSAATGCTLATARKFRAQCLGQDGIPGTRDDRPARDVASACSQLGIKTDDRLLSVTSPSKRVLSRAATGDWQLVMSAWVSGKTCLDVEEHLSNASWTPVRAP